MATIDRLQGARTSKAIKAPVLAATTANITLSGEQTIDGVALVSDDRVLVKDQTDGKENGIYVVANGAWTRARDFNKDNDITEGTTVFVNQGTVNGNIQMRLATADPVIGTTSMAFVRSGGTQSPTPVGDGEIPAWDGTDGLGFQRTDLYVSDGGVGDVRLGLGVVPEAQLHILDEAPQIRLEDSDLANSEMQIIFDGQQGTIRVDPNAVVASSYFTVFIDGSQAFRINANGQIGTNGVNPIADIHVSSAAPAIRLADTDGGYGQINAPDGSLTLQADLGNTQAGTFLRFTVDGGEVARFDANGRLGLGATVPDFILDMEGATDAMRIPVGTTAQRPTPQTGALRFNTTAGSLEVYDGSDWLGVATGYEEGTFTPQVQNVNASEVATHTLQDGSFVRNGKLVHVHGVLTVSAIGTMGAGSSCYIGGLPYPAEIISGWTPYATIHYNTQIDGLLFGGLSNSVGRMSLIQRNGATWDVSKVIGDFGGYPFTLDFNFSYIADLA